MINTICESADVLEPPSEHEDEVEMRNRFYESASARKRTVTAEEREKAMNEAKAFEPSNPFCRVVLRPSYLYRGCIMVISRILHIINLLFFFYILILASYILNSFGFPVSTILLCREAFERYFRQYQASNL
jgi:hypothetical protein